jgi:hypothetical protein
MAEEETIEQPHLPRLIYWFMEARKTRVRIAKGDPLGSAILNPRMTRPIGPKKKTMMMM